MKYDVAIIGGGPAGLIAAGRAAELGASVILLEKNINPGNKLLLSGNGRCNLTNKKDDAREFISRFGKNGKFLFSSLHLFGVDETMDFFHSLEVPTKTENDGKVFPASEKAQDILSALSGYLKKLHVDIKTQVEADKMIKQDKRIKKIKLKNGEEILADKYIICTGGRSFPATGSSGDGYKWARALGHTIIEPAPGLTAILLKEKFIKELEGLSLHDVGISIYNKNRKISASIGDAIFTANGISGPAIMDMSSIIARQKIVEATLKIDFCPTEDMVIIDKRLQDEFQKNNSKQIKNMLSSFLAPKFLPVALSIINIDPQKTAGQITRNERKAIVNLLKYLSLNMESLAGFERAYVTTGGVSLSEVDPKNMRSKIIENLFFAGEILDLDGPTGGYNLQMCWTTGYAAGSGAANKKYDKSQSEEN